MRRPRRPLQSLPSPPRAPSPATPRRAQTPTPPRRHHPRRLPQAAPSPVTAAAHRRRCSSADGSRPCRRPSPRGTASRASRRRTAAACRSSARVLPAAWPAPPAKSRPPMAARGPSGRRGAGALEPHGGGAAWRGRLARSADSTRASPSRRGRRMAGTRWRPAPRSEGTWQPGSSRKMPCSRAARATASAARARCRRSKRLRARPTQMSAHVSPDEFRGRSDRWPQHQRVPLSHHTCLHGASRPPSRWTPPSRRELGSTRRPACPESAAGCRRAAGRRASSAEEVKVASQPRHSR